MTGRLVSGAKPIAQVQYFKVGHHLAGDSVGVRASSTGQEANVSQGRTSVGRRGYSYNLASELAIALIKNPSRSVGEEREEILSEFESITI